MEEARALDGQDRFLNWKAAKYLMRAGDVEGGVQLLGLFTKVNIYNLFMHIASTRLRF